MTVTNRILRAIRNSGGRFFGLYTKGGETLNAQLVGETNAFVTVYDRNAFANRKFAKTSLVGVRIGGGTIGSTTN
jgi:hypothetical protein